MNMNFTPTDLERLLVQEVTTWTQDMLFKNPQDRGKVPVGLSVYQGHIPSYQAGPRSEKTLPKAPSVSIKTSSARYARKDGVCTISFLIVTWDDNNNRRGYIDVSNIINRIVFGLYETVMVAQSFVLTDDEVHTELVDDPAMDLHPYYLGSIQAKFGLMTPGPGFSDPFISGFTDTGEFNDTGSDTLPVTSPGVSP
jgi:hypothetical protein